MVQLVGILNITPDSFSDGGDFFNSDVALMQAERLFSDGASLIDIGAESTRPNAVVLTDEQEWQRLEPVLKVLLPKYPGKISIDSYHSATIRKAWDLGPIIINDVTGFNSPDMVRLVGKLKSTVIISHLPTDMTIAQAHALTPITSVNQVKNELLERARALQNAGLKPSQIILDPGIGFGKLSEINQQLLTFGEQVLDYKVMIGYSRKRFLGEHRMELKPNLVAGQIAIAHSAAYLRVHDVAGHRALLR
jgi:dihydropteroate synthase